jgi:putative tryptophan/tyrosine transport system substrate-binding protein
MQFDPLKRRDFITLLGGAAAGWPLAARAQQSERVRRVGVLLIGAGNDPAWQVYADALRQGLTETGYVEGRNLRLNIAGRKATTIDCRLWRLIWFVSGSL